VDILETIQPCSVRAVAYQLFSRGAIDSMDKATTNRVGALLTRAREEGEIPWEWIVQEGRAVESVATWDDPAAYARTVQASYRRNKWEGQPTRVIVVSEKGTVRGTLAPILGEYEVDFLPVGGYASATRVYELASIDTSAQPLLLLYLGDEDPSGRGMSDSDLPKRLARYASGFTAEDRWGEDEIAATLAEQRIDLRRIALTAADTVALGPDLGFPASDKAKDPRYQWFVNHFGHRCWELDAMNPALLRVRVEDAIRAELDLAEWERYVVAEQVERESITQALGAWTSISGLASKYEARRT
jgi:hypothetical protein